MTCQEDYFHVVKHSVNIQETNSASEVLDTRGVIKAGRNKAFYVTQAWVF